MKQLLLSLILVFTASITKAQTYTPMINNQKGWCLESVAGLGSIYYKFQYSNDTIINGKTFQEFSGTSRKSLFYEDIQNKRVYKYDTTNQTTELLYDFSLVKGDTLTISFKGFKPILMTVSLVDSIITDNLDTLTIIHFNHNDTSFVNGYRLLNNFKWIEGVGSNWHPNYIDNYTTTSNFVIGDFGSYLFCVYTNGKLLYVNDSARCEFVRNTSICNFFPSSLSSPAKPHIKVYPSPFSNYFTIDTENIEAVTLYDMLGRMVYHSEIKSTNPILVFFENELEAGYYQLEVKTKAGVLTQKVMKQ